MRYQAKIMHHEPAKAADQRRTFPSDSGPHFEEADSFFGNLVFLTERNSTHHGGFKFDDDDAAADGRNLILFYHHLI